MTDRRTFLMGAGLWSSAAIAAQSPGPINPDPMLDPSLDTALKDFASAQDAFGRLYDVDRSIANFDAAYYGAMPKPVHAAYLERTAWVNKRNSLYLRNAIDEAPRDELLNQSRRAVADLIGASMDEVALCNGGTEGLYSLIINYRPLTAGDAVIIADIDYDEMQHAMEHLEASRGAKLVRLAIPEPHTPANVLGAYEKVLRDTPRAKLLLLTHVSNRNGLVTPVRDIVSMAKARGVDVILDSAQAVGQLPFSVAETGADFIGFSLHKWVAAPLGTGAVYIRRERIADIAPFLGNKIRDEDDVRARILTGTINYAAHLSIPTAIQVHRRIGGERKLRHLQALRDYWMDRVRDVPGVTFQLPRHGVPYGAISSFRLPNVRSWEAAKALQARYIKRHRLLVVAKNGLASGPVMRVTPSLFNTTAELDRLVEAIRAEARSRS